MIDAAPHPVCGSRQPADRPCNGARQKRREQQGHQGRKDKGHINDAPFAAQHVVNFAALGGKDQRTLYRMKALDRDRHQHNDLAHHVEPHHAHRGTVQRRRYFGSALIAIKAIVFVGRVVMAEEPVAQTVGQVFKPALPGDGNRRADIGLDDVAAPIEKARVDNHVPAIVDDLAADGGIGQQPVQHRPGSVRRDRKIKPRLSKVRAVGIAQLVKLVRVDDD